MSPLIHKYPYAFPSIVKMEAGSKIYDDGQITTLTETSIDVHFGLTVRDYYAASAMQGLLHVFAAQGKDAPCAAQLAVNAFKIADSMIKQSRV